MAILTASVDEIMPYLEIDLFALDSCMAKHATTYVYLAQFAAEAAGNLVDARNRVDALKSAKFIQYKSGAADTQLAGTRGISDETAKSLATQDDEVAEANLAVMQARVDETFWAHVMNAMQQRGFLLKEIASQNAQNRTDATRIFKDQTQQELWGAANKRDSVNPEEDTRDMMLQSLEAAMKRRK